MPAPPPESEPAMIRIRAVGVTLRAFDPFCGAKLSMCTKSSLARQIPRIGSRRRLDGLADVVDHLRYEVRIVAFGHHPAQRLGARFADHEAAAAFELRLRRGDALPHAVGLERLRAAVEVNVLQKLRKRLELPQKRACGRLGLD